jgi:hypothetical protein
MRRLVGRRNAKGSANFSKEWRVAVGWQNSKDNERGMDVSSRKHGNGKGKGKGKGKKGWPENKKHNRIHAEREGATFRWIPANRQTQGQGTPPSLFFCCSPAPVKSQDKDTVSVIHHPTDPHLIDVAEGLNSASAIFSGVITYQSSPLIDTDRRHQLCGTKHSFPFSTFPPISRCNSPIDWRAAVQGLTRQKRVSMRGAATELRFGSIRFATRQALQ